MMYVCVYAVTLSMRTISCGSVWLNDTRTTVLDLC